MPAAVDAGSSTTEAPERRAQARWKSLSKSFTRGFSKGFSRSSVSEVDALAAQDRRRKALEALAETLTDCGNGSLLRGWRCELDPAGILEVDAQDLSKAAKRLSWSGDVHSIFHEDASSSSLSIEDLAEQQGQLLKRFKAWVKEAFETPTQMFEALDIESAGSIQREAFFLRCKEHGFQGDDKDLGEIFDCCDWGESGSIVKEDVIFLGFDTEFRQQLLLKAQNQSMHEWRHQIAQEYLEQSKKPAADSPQQKHRLALRPWQAKTFEQLPAIACQQRNDRRRCARQREQQAKEDFLHHLRESYGSEVRALRRFLGVDGNFSGFTQSNLRYYCRKVDLDINPKDLWKALDRDGDGTVGMTELCVKPSMALARFKRWAVTHFSSCADIWDTPEAVTARSRTRRNAFHSEKKMLFVSFSEALRELEWPSANDHTERSLVLSSLDSFGCGLIMRSDLEWLDKWKPPEWLHAEPDNEAWLNLRGLLMRIYRTPLHAWRRLLDRDGTGKISWDDFKGACAKLRFKGKAAGCWRALDTEMAGFVTLMEFDAGSGRLLASFKDWAESNYVSVAQCFRKLEDEVGLVAYPVLKRACRELKWSGDVRAVFDCLSLDDKRNSSGQRAVSFSEVAFLDSWDLSLGEGAADADYAEATSSWLKMSDWAGSHSSSPRSSVFLRVEGASGVQPIEVITSDTESLASTMPTSDLLTPKKKSRGSPVASATFSNVNTPSTMAPSTPSRSTSTPMLSSPCSSKPKPMLGGAVTAEPAEKEAQGDAERHKTATPSKLFPLIPPAWRSSFGIGGDVPNKQKAVKTVKTVKSLTRSVTLPGGIDALRTNTYPRQQGFMEAFGEEEGRFPGAAVTWQADGLLLSFARRPASRCRKLASRSGSRGEKLVLRPVSALHEEKV